MSRHPELLIPASSLEVLKTAVYIWVLMRYISAEKSLDCVLRRRISCHDDMKERESHLHTSMACVSM